MTKSANADLLDAIRERMRVCKEELEIYKEKSQTYYDKHKEEAERREKVGCPQSSRWSYEQIHVDFTNVFLG